MLVNEVLVVVETTVNATENGTASRSPPGMPVTVTVYTPKGAVEETRNEPCTKPDPKGSEQVGAGEEAKSTFGVAMMVQPLSNVLKPVPLTPTKMP